LRSRIFSLEEVLHEAIEIHAQPDPGGAEAGRGRDGGAGSVPRAWNQYGNILQMAQQIRRYGRLADYADVRSLRRGTVASRSSTSRHRSKLTLFRRRSQKTLGPPRRREVARWAVEEKGPSARFACEAFGLSESGYRYQPKLNAENVRIADRLLRLTENQRSWGFGLCFPYLRNVKGFRFNHKRVYQIYCEIALNYVSSQRNA